MLFQLAFRNLRRNFRRSLITALAVSVGVMVLILSNTLRAGQYDDMIHSSVSQLAGHVVIQHPEYQEEQENDLVVQNRSDLAATLSSAFPDATVTMRTQMGGILTSSSAPSVVVITAIAPEAEAFVSDMDEKLVDGTWVVDDKRSLVIGQNMAKTLQVDVGDKLVFTTSVDGEMNSHLYRLSGIFRTGAEEVDAFVGYAALQSSDEILGQPNTANQIALHLSNANDTDKVHSKVSSIVSESNRTETVYSWPEVLPDVLAMINVDQVSNEMISFSLMFIVAMGVLNTMLMNVLERRREFGVLMAIGLQRIELVKMILMESALLGIIGGLIGVVLGLLVSYPLVVNGLDLTEMMGEGMTINGAVSSTIMYGRYDWKWIATYILLSILCSVLSALYPAWKIQQMTPVNAMRS